MPSPFLRLEAFLLLFEPDNGGRVLPPSEWRGRRFVGRSCMLLLLWEQLQVVRDTLALLRLLHQGAAQTRDLKH